jgi:hypothetical protein
MGLLATREYLSQNERGSIDMEASRDRRLSETDPFRMTVNSEPHACTALVCSAVAHPVPAPRRLA